MGHRAGVQRHRNTPVLQQVVTYAGNIKTNHTYVVVF